MNINILYIKNLFNSFNLSFKLDNIVGDKTGCANGRLAHFCHRLLAIGQNERALLIEKADLAVDHRQRVGENRFGGGRRGCGIEGEARHRTRRAHRHRSGMAGDRRAVSNGA